MFRSISLKFHALANRIYFGGHSPLRWVASFVSLLAVMFVLLLSFRPSVPVSAPVGWEKTFPVTPLRIKMVNSDVASRGNFVTVAFEGMENGKRTINLSLSVNGGLRFFSPYKIAEYSIPDNLYAPMNPRVAISSAGDIFLVWQGYSPDDFSYRIFYSHSSDFGGTFTEPRKLVFETPMDFIPYVFYDMANRLHILYHSYTKEQFNLYQAIAGKGLSFDESEKIVSLPKEFRGAFFPAVGINGENIFIVWQGKSSSGGALNDDLYLIHSSNSGRSWSSYKQITSAKGNDSTPSLCFHEGKLYCVYQNNDAGNWKINMISSVDGDQFTEPRVVLDTNANCYAPVAASSGDKLVIFFYDARERINNISAAEFDTNDERFTRIVRISDNKIPSVNPRALTFGARVLCLWEEGIRVSGKFSDVDVDPPVLFSRTHPLNRWSTAQDAVIEWTAPKDESGLEGYAVIVNSERYFNPTVVNLNANVSSYKIPFLSDGITYFHIRAVDKSGNFSRTISYPLKVSRNSLPMPLIVSSTHPQGVAVPANAPKFTWSIAELDRVKGYYYSFSKDIPEAPRLFTTDTAVSFENLANGRYFLSVKGVDKADIPGRPNIYEIIVGEAGKAEPGIYVIKEEPVPQHLIVKLPVPPKIELDLSVKDENGVILVSSGFPQSAKAISFSGVLYRGDAVWGELMSQDGQFEIASLPEGSYRFVVSAAFSWRGKQINSRGEKILNITRKELTRGIPAYALNTLPDVSSGKWVATQVFISSLLMMVFAFRLRARFVFGCKKRVFSLRNGLVTFYRRFF